MKTFNLLPETFPSPPADLVQAAKEDSSVRGMLADWMEENGDPRADNMHNTCFSIDFVLAQQPKPASLPVEAELEIWGNEALTPKQRLEAFLRIDPYRRKGAHRIRERQERVRYALKAKSIKRIPDFAVTGDEPIEFAKRTMTREQYRTQRQRNRQSFARKAQAQGHNEFALSCANSYHHHIASLYASKRGSVVLGRGGQEDYDPDAYSRAYRSQFGGARWCNAGVRVEYSSIRGPGVIIIQNFRGTTKARIPIPRNYREITFDGLLDGDIWAIPRRIAGQTLLVRYGLNGRTGVALWCTLPNQKEGYWEHGNSIKECRRAYAEKLEAAKRWMEEHREELQIERKIRLIMRLCKNLRVTREDQRASGYCDTGVRAFCDRYAIDLNREFVLACELRATDDERVERPIQAAARRVAKIKL